jgi:hypothetical protein
MYQGFGMMLIQGGRRQDVAAEVKAEFTVECVIVGPSDRLSGTYEAARTKAIDLAVLDGNIAGKKAYPLTDVLAARQVPFLLLPGCGTKAVPGDDPDWPMRGKPSRTQELADMLVEQVRRG